MPACASGEAAGMETLAGAGGEARPSKGGAPAARPTAAGLGAGWGFGGLEMRPHKATESAHGKTRKWGRIGRQNHGFRGDWGLETRWNVRVTVCERREDRRSAVSIPSPRYGELRSSLLRSATTFRWKIAVGPPVMRD
jgi:hypothetical protein